MTTLKDERLGIRLPSKEPDFSGATHPMKDLSDRIDLIGLHVTNLIESNAEILHLVKEVLAIVKKT
jgi:hypothetical protein